ncbi:MAG: response regulator [Prochlorotrichaceae cyanobacterium]|jgi:CheY-like chemotaxis protein
MTNHKILIVDDEEHLRELVQACLEDLAGWQTYCAASGEDCLQLLQTESVDAILLDISMPGMDGMMVYERIKATPQHQSIPVIFLTAKVLPSDRAKFIQIGVTGIIPKPIDPATLVFEIAEILGWDSGNFD